MRTFAQLILHSAGGFTWSAEQVPGFLRSMARVGGDRVRLFAYAGNHAHVVVEGTAAEIAHLRSVLRRTKPFSDVLDPEVKTRPVEDRDHLATLPGYYARQALHHDLRCDPALWLGSPLPDLVGARRIPGLDLGPLALALPHVDLAETVLRAVGLDGPVIPADDGQIHRIGAISLWTACVDAVALAPDRASDLGTRVRGVFARLAKLADLHGGDARDAARISRSAWFRYAALDPVDPALEGVVRARVGLVLLATATPPFARRPTEKTPPPTLLPTFRGRSRADAARP